MAEFCYFAVGFGTRRFGPPFYSRRFGTPCFLACGDGNSSFCKRRFLQSSRAPCICFGIHVCAASLQSVSGLGLDPKGKNQDAAPKVSVPWHACVSNSKLKFVKPTHLILRRGLYRFTEKELAEQDLENFMASSSDDGLNEENLASYRAQLLSVNLPG